MKHSNPFKPNVVPTSVWAKRQWDWNWLRKTKLKVNGTRKDFIDGALGIHLFTAHVYDEDAGKWRSHKYG